MSISLTCQCGKPYTVPDEYAGRNVKCKKCGNVFRVDTQEQIDFSAPPDDYGVVGGATSYTSEPADEAQWDPASQQPSTYDAASAWVIDQNTAASNSGRMQINFGKYLSCHPTALAVELLSILVGTAGALALWHPAPLIMAGLGVFMLLSTIAKLRGKFLSGDVNPAVVVSARPWRVAVFANMTKGEGMRPAIQILDAPLGKMTGGPPQVGQYLAAVCLYSHAPGDAWGDFDPTIVQCAITEPSIINRVMASISPGEWKQLDRSLRQLPHRTPGLYKLWLGTENTVPSGFQALLVKGFMVLVCAVPVITIVANAAKKKPGSEQTSSSTDTPSDKRRRAAPQNDASADAVQPPPDSTGKPRAIQNSESPPKPQKRDNDLWGDIAGGTVTLDAKPAPARPSTSSKVTAEATVPLAVEPSSRKPVPALVTPEAEPPPIAAEVPDRSSRLNQAARPASPRTIGRTPPVAGVNKNVTFQVGQNVEVYHVGRSRVGRVVRIDQGQYAVAFDRMPDISARKFAADQIRVVR